MNLNTDINLTSEQMQTIQKSDKQLLIKTISTFLVCFSTAGYLAVGAPGLATFLNYTKTTAAKFSKIGKYISNFIIKHPLLSTGAAVLVADKTGVLEKPLSVIKVGVLGVGAYLVYNFFKK